MTRTVEGITHIIIFFQYLQFDAKFMLKHKDWISRRKCILLNSCCEYVVINLRNTGSHCYIDVAVCPSSWGCVKKKEEGLTFDYHRIKNHTHTHSIVSVGWSELWLDEEKRQRHFSVCYLVNLGTSGTHFLKETARCGNKSRDNRLIELLLLLVDQERDSCVRLNFHNICSVASPGNIQQVHNVQFNKIQVKHTFVGEFFLACEPAHLLCIIFGHVEI